MVAAILRNVSSVTVMANSSRLIRYRAAVADLAAAVMGPAADILGSAAKATEDLEEAERGVVQRAIARAEGNVSLAANSLGISRATLHRKLARFGIRRPH